MIAGRGRFGAGGRTRTDMSVTSLDFESSAYTNFATPAVLARQYKASLSHSQLLSKRRSSSVQSCRFGRVRDMPVFPYWDLSFSLKIQTLIVNEVGRDLGDVPRFTEHHPGFHSCSWAHCLWFLIPSSVCASLPQLQLNPNREVGESLAQGWCWRCECYRERTPVR